MEQKPAIPPKPKLTKNVKTQVCGKKDPPKKYSEKVSVHEGETRKIPRERKSLGAIKIPGIVKRRDSLTKDNSPATVSRTNSIKKNVVKPVLPERKRLSLASTLPAKRSDNNNLTSVQDKNPRKDPSSVLSSHRRVDNLMKDPKQKLTVLSKTSPSLGEALKRSNSACKPAPVPQARILNVRRKSSDNILDAKSTQGSKAIAPLVSKLTRGKPVTACRGKTQSPGLVKQDSFKSKSELGPTAHSQLKVSSERSKPLNPTQAKLKLTPGSTQTKSVLPSKPRKEDILDLKNKDSATKRSPKSNVSKPFQRSKSVVLSDKKHSPVILNTGLSESIKLTPVPHTDSGKKGLSHVAEIEYSINGLSSRSLEDKETILGLRRTLEDNLKKFNVMALCFQNVISKNDYLNLRLANKNEEVKSLQGSLADLQVSVQILK